MTRDVDVLIIGGGPSGLAAAIVLARAGVSVLLCEQQRFPVDKPCGEGLMPTGVVDLHKLGVAIPDGVSFAGIRYYAPDGTVATGHFQEGPGRGIRRTRLSAALLDAACSHPTLCLTTNVEARPVRATPEGIEVQVSRERVRARLLIGADGLHSGVRRWAGLEREERRYWRWGARRHYRLAPWSDLVEVYWSGRGVEAYVTPVAAGEVGVAFLWGRNRYDGLQGGRSLIPSLLAAFPELERRLHGASPISQTRAVGPLQQRTEAVTADGVLLLGDAAGYVDAITGEGMSLAFAEALSLEETVLPLLQTGRGLIRHVALSGYRQAQASLVRGPGQVIQLALLLSRYPALCNRLTAALSHDATLFQQVLSANMGTRSLWRPLVLGRLLVAAGRSFFGS